MLEPMALGVSTLSGPHVFNFQSIADELAAAGALEVVSGEQLAEACCQLLENSAAATKQKEAAERVLAANRGALQRQLDLVVALRP